MLSTPYNIAFAIGYYYGRAHPTSEEVVIAEQDMYHRANQGFEDGLTAGRRDFCDVDLPIQALAQEQMDPALGINQFAEFLSGCPERFRTKA